MPAVLSAMAAVVYLFPRLRYAAWARRLVADDDLAKRVPRSTPIVLVDAEVAE